jgi:non-structural maintenance of chromosomes element 4
MLQNAEMGAAMARAMKHDTEAFDVDDFIATLVTFMGGRSSTAPEDDEGEAIDDTRPLEWEKIGQRAYMHSRKAPCMDFMSVSNRFKCRMRTDAFQGWPALH